MSERRPGTALGDRPDRDSLLSTWVDGLKGALHPLFAESLGEETLQACLRAHVAERMASAQRRENAERERQHFAAASPHLEDFTPRVVELPESGPVLLSLHFKAQRIDAPFVELLLSAKPLRTEGLRELAGLARRIYDRVQPLPLFLRLYRGSHIPELGPGKEPDQRLIAGDLRSIARAARPRAALSAELRSVVSFAGLHDRYRKAFDAFVSDHPVVGAELWPTSLSEFEDLNSTGCVREVWIDDQWAGVIAANVEDGFWGIPCHVIYEELLDEPFRGRGLAPVLQYEFLQHLDRERSNLVVGTIHALNHASRRTAQRAGRIDVGGYDFYPTAMENGHA